ncbi:TonB-dependent receptor [Novosphingobium piscinae]|uniref:TonB-dependent receptor n=1 Tax=Novosphingobium piscinae TaxID=1507448 RepID=A0A7X1FYD6_9SPHN|nr:TonB-dependent receptor [Novosphingobium piscinae]MBC2669289.1 TonB-dependent receptor [Novosphingobium piscinae]
MKAHLLFESATLAIALLASSGTAQAQAKAQEAEADADSSGNLQDIVVTAQRRGENLQKVPIAVSAVTGEMAAALGIRTSQDIIAAAPAVTFAETNSGANITIRGVGGSGSAADEPGNAIYIDGVYQAAAPGLIFALHDIDRIEVAKGPQGTLFGRNSTGGVIQIITKEPSDQLRADMAVSYGNYSTVEAKGVISGPLGGGFTASVSAFYQNQAEGWGRNIFDGSKAYFGHSGLIRAKLKWESPDNRTSVLLSHMYVNTRPVASRGGAIIPGQITTSGGGIAGVGNPGFYNINQSYPTGRHLVQNQTALTVQHDMNWAKLVNILAYTDTKNDIWQDVDFGPAPARNVYLKNPVSTVTNELQLLSPSGSKINWSMGLYYLHNVLGLRPSVFTGTAFAAQGGSLTTDNASTTSSYSAYGQFTIPILTGTNFTGGLRYTYDDRSIAGYQITGTGVRTNVDTGKVDKKLTWRLAVDHQFSDQLLGYVSYNRGYKSGLYNVASPAQPPVDPVVVDAYEVGFKTQMLDNTVRFNASAFLYDFEGIQLRAVTSAGATFLLNAASAWIKGVDAELTIAPTRNFTIQASGSFLDTEYRNFANAPFFRINTAGGLTQFTGNANGNDLIYSPRWVGSVGADYKIPTAVGTFALAGNVYYNDGFAFDPQGLVRQTGYTVANANVSWSDPSETLDVQFWARNFTKSQYYTSVAVSTSGAQYFPGAPRTFGVTIGYKFR